MTTHPAVRHPRSNHPDEVETLVLLLAVVLAVTELALSGAFATAGIEPADAGMTERPDPRPGVPAVRAHRADSGPSASATNRGHVTRRSVCHCFLRPGQAGPGRVSSLAVLFGAR